MEKKWQCGEQLWQQYVAKDCIKKVTFTSPNVAKKWKLPHEDI